MSDPVLRAVALEKTYAPLSPGAPGLILFRDLSLDVHPGEMVAIVGQSGTGKSSLLHLLAALDRPTAGEVWCGAINVTTLNPTQGAQYRNRDIGYVWQFHYLLPEFTALENIAMPLLARGLPHEQATAKAAIWLDRVGLGSRRQNRSGELSGGEQQRVSLARALVTEPKVLLADEPTGDLDAVTASDVFDLLQQIQRNYALASVFVTHNLDFAAKCDRVLRLTGGSLLPV